MNGGLALERWTNFYLLTGTAAATLIGLLFVVITLATDRQPGEAPKIGLYLTPTVALLGSDLLLAALMTFPDHSALSARLCACGVGGAGLVYSGSLIIGRRESSRYHNRRVAVQFALVPGAAYALLAAGGALIGREPQALTVVAVAMIALLGLAVRNSWAIAVAMVTLPVG